MRKKLLSLGAIAMDIVLNSHDLPKDDGFALIQSEKMLPGGECVECVCLRSTSRNGCISDWKSRGR